MQRRNTAAPAPLQAGEAEAMQSQSHLPLLQPLQRIHPPLVPLLLLRRVLFTQPSSLALPLALASASFYCDPAACEGQDGSGGC